VTAGILTATLGAWAFGLASVVAWSAMLRGGGAGPSRVAPKGTVTLLRPCCGAEPWLREALLSTATPRRPFPMRVLFAVASTEDAAWPVARGACETLRTGGLDVEVVVTGAVGPNRKADQLSRALAAERLRADLVVVVDSDVELDVGSLEALVEPLTQPATGASWLAPSESAPQTIGDRASNAVLGSSLHAFAVLGLLDRGGLVGKVMAIRRDALDDLGGFGALVRFLGEDLELARRLHAQGWTTALAAGGARSLARGRAWTNVVERYVRWLLVIRAQRTALLLTYPLLFAATPLVVVLSLIAARADGVVGLIPGAVAIAARLAGGFVARRKTGGDSSPTPLIVAVVLADVLLLRAFWGAIRARETTWRGRRLRQAPGGTFTELA
jgi:ceramide glucosyltransferase